LLKVYYVYLSRNLVSEFRKLSEIKKDSKRNYQILFTFNFEEYDSKNKVENAIQHLNHMGNFDKVFYRDAETK
jgi:uncharacterized protein YegP (UPF0339 family)